MSAHEYSAHGDHKKVAGPQKLYVGVVLSCLTWEQNLVKYLLLTSESSIQPLLGSYLKRELFVLSYGVTG